MVWVKKKKKKLKPNGAFFSTVAGRGHRGCVAPSPGCVGVWHRFRWSSDRDRQRRKEGEAAVLKGRERKAQRINKKHGGANLSLPRGFFSLPPSETHEELSESFQTFFSSSNLKVRPSGAEVRVWDHPTVSVLGAAAIPTDLGGLSFGPSVLLLVCCANENKPAMEFQGKHMLFFLH